MIVIGKGEAIVFRQSAECAEPHEAIGILRDMKNMVLGEAIIGTEEFKNSR